MSGRKVTLTPTSLLHLSEMERLVLQKLAVARLQALQLGCPITVPKGKNSTSCPSNITPQNQPKQEECLTC